VHAVALLLPAGELEPTGQGEHSPGPLTFLKVPGWQSLQTAFPVVSLKVPALQISQDTPLTLQDTPLRPVYPAEHSQSVMLSLPSSEVEPKGQSTHTEFPRWCLNVPRVHALHNPPSGPLYPMLHMQAVKTILPDEDIACDGQRVHVKDAGTDVYVPAAQPEHVTLPVTFL